MPYLTSFFLITLALLSYPLQATADSNPWAHVQQPSPVKAESIGTYTAGCISGAATLPINGNGYQVMRLSRKRNFGHPNLVFFIEKLGQVAVNEDWGGFLVGDLGQPRGGPTLSGHRSHQTGLDVDIWYLLSPVTTHRQLSADERESWAAPSVLRPLSDNLDPKQWSPKQERMLEMAASMPEVDRIFVHAAVKRQLCQHFAKRSWLRKIRPWYKHDDHFHVRLKCPEESRDCQHQEVIPEGDGCDASLDWWFSEEAKTPSKPSKPSIPPALPSRCDLVLRQ
ncbi:MAG: penicillin-insensitive murein endopeptidase [Methylococcaceae bacterium]|jgi:penicillin-insensitive murein endopeptidase